MESSGDSWPEGFLDDALDVLQSIDVGDADRAATLQSSLQLAFHAAENGWVGGQQVRDETNTVGRLQASIVVTRSHAVGALFTTRHGGVSIGIKGQRAAINCRT